MAGTLKVADTIQSSGFPLAFKVAQGAARTPLLGMAVAEDVMKVEVRAMGGHQKECVVTDGIMGSAWRLVSDEGAALTGTDLAPFPLGFMSAGYQAELQGRIMRLAAARAIAINSLRTELVNQYGFAGSFFRGTGRGSALAPAFRVLIESPAKADEIRALVKAASDASPLIASVRTALHNTFALYVNGQRRTPLEVPPSANPDAPDPLKTWKGVPQPLATAGADAAPLDGIVTKISEPPADTGLKRPPMTADTDVRFAIDIRGASSCKDGVTTSQTWADAPRGSTFGVKSDERAAHDAAPSGLAIAASGVAFCLMTQLLRYSEYRKYQIRAVRLVQYWPMAQTLGASGSLTGSSGNLDTHVFLHGEETDENMGHLLASSANTCYLHAMLGGALEPQIEVELNGAKL